MQRTDEKTNEQVISYQTPGGGIVLNLTQAQIEQFRAAGVWPRDSEGTEYCSVRMGLHWGRPSFSETQVLDIIQCDGSVDLAYFC